MKVFIDIGHPAHVHYFKNLIIHLENNNHSIVITARDKEMTHYLLKSMGFSYYDRKRGKASAFGKLIYLIQTNIRIFKLAKMHKPDLFIGFGSPYAAQVAFFLKKPSVILDDTENAKFGQLFYKKFATTVLSPTTFCHNFGSKHLKFDGYMELSYLHPNYFRPSFDKLSGLSLQEGEKYSVVRFVSWEANHDYGHAGMSMSLKKKAIESFSKHGKVFISSESKLPKELEAYRLELNPEHIHHLIAFASLLFGESATMASEAAILGVPAIYIDNEGRGYTTEQQEKFGLVYNYTESESDQKKSIYKGVEILSSSSIAHKTNRNSLLMEKIDVTAFLIWFVENYPASAKTLRENPDYQYRFK